MGNTSLFEIVQRESATERKVRAMDACEIVDEIHNLEDMSTALGEALEKLLECPAIAELPHSTLEDGLQESLDAKLAALAVLDVFMRGVWRK